MQNKKLKYGLTAALVCILLIGAGLLIYDTYRNRAFVPPPYVAREPIPEPTMPPRQPTPDPQPIEEPPDENDEPEYIPPEPPPPRDILPRVLQLREQYNNPDIVGYIYIPNTNISYPVLQTGNNEFYLYHDVHMQPNRDGSIFVDYENNIHLLWDDNTIIFGHNMRGGNKFHNIRHFHGVNYFNDRRHIYLTTPHEETIWETFSFFATTTQEPDRDYMITNFPTEAMYFEFIQYMQSRSIHETDVVLTPLCQILILSTCASNNASGIHRYVLLARLMR